MATQLRQMSQVYLRGSLANETMKYATPEQQQQTNQLVNKLLEWPALQGQKNEFINKLARSIKGDYKDDREHAIAEYRIAVWKAAVQLLHHTNYHFICQNCKTTSYKTIRGKKKAFDRRYPECPSCTCVKINDPGDSDFVEGQYVKFEKFQAATETSISRITRVSPIIGIAADHKVSNYQEILNDEVQLAKYVGQFVLNYYRQIIRENKITKELKLEQIVGPADQILVKELLTVLDQCNVKCSYLESGNPFN